MIKIEPCTSVKIKGEKVAIYMYIHGGPKCLFLNIAPPCFVQFYQSANLNLFSCKFNGISNQNKITKLCFNKCIIFGTRARNNIFCFYWGYVLKVLIPPLLFTLITYFSNILHFFQECSEMDIFFYRKIGFKCCFPLCE